MCFVLLSIPSNTYLISDSELIGFPYQVVFGKIWIEQEKVELTCRLTGEKSVLTSLEAINMLVSDVQILV